VETGASTTRKTKGKAGARLTTLRGKRWGEINEGGKNTKPVYFCAEREETQRILRREDAITVRGGGLIKGPGGATA